MLSDILTDQTKFFLDDLLVVHMETINTKFTWLKQRATSHSPESILTTLAKIKFLHNAGVNHWDLSILNANRLKISSRLGKCSTNQALQRSVPEKRYPVLIAFLHQALEELIDEAVDLFDQALSQSYSRSRNSLKRHQAEVQESTNEKVRLLKAIGSIILDDEIADPELRKTLFGKVSLEKLKSAIDECDHLMRPENDKCVDYFAKRFQYLRQFTPAFIAQLEFQSLQENHPVLQAVQLIHELNQQKLKKNTR